ncbi:phosphatidylinositol phosphate synthase [Actinomyces gerencseriae]|uniref:phosphatidylinositol phosphate synthase n=1 Tax=Actinomyces gerencseriae TaxID=52769 RepID=UPI0028EA7715|nr:CDP-alcohol phosphatidyltransferase family protein [Actinomyces gerencseriae]
MLGQHGRGLTRALLTRPALAMARAGITPNMLTVAGTVASVGAAVATLPRGHFIAGPPLLAVVLVGDSFDGVLARATGRTSVFGAFLDSTLDRLADGAVFASLAAWAALTMTSDSAALRTVTVVLALVCVVLAATVPYARARAESIGATASVGIAERTDRLVVALVATFAVGLGAPQWVLSAALGYVALASFITVLQRIVAVRRQMTDRAAAGADSGAEPGADA